MKLLAATVLSLSIVAGAANGQQTIIEGVKAMPTTEDIRAVAPALERYAKDVVLGDLWKRPGLPARDRSMVTVAALIARDQMVELPYYLNLALDNGVKPAELSEIIWKPTTEAAMPADQQGRLRSLVDALESLDDVQNVYTTAVID